MLDLKTDLVLKDEEMHGKRLRQDEGISVHIMGIYCIFYFYKYEVLSTEIFIIDGLLCRIKFFYNEYRRNKQD